MMSPCPSRCARPVRVLRRALLPMMVASALAAPAQAADLLTIARDALQNNAALSSERAVTRSTEEERRVQRGDLLPQVNTSAEMVHNRQDETQSRGGVISASGTAGDDSYNTARLTLEATQALYDAINSREVVRAERQIDQQLYRLAATEQQVLIDVSTAYFEILRAYEVLQARLAQERAIGRQLEQAREQFEVGLIAITEVEEAQASFDRSRAERIAAESDLQVRFEELERLTGQRYENIEALGQRLPIRPPEFASRDHWVELAMQNNPLVLASQAGIEVSRSSVDIARAQRLPTLDAFASYQYSDSDEDGVTGHDEYSQLGLRASLPLYTGGRTSASIRQNTYLLESSQYDFEDQRRSTIQEVRSRYTRVTNDVSTIEARAQAVVSNQSALDATRAGYEVGTRNIVDVLNAEQNLYDAIAEHASARYDYVINRLSLRQQSGLLDVEALQQINAYLDGGSVAFQLPDEAGSDPVMEIGERPMP
ncbi:TolC family outer membrane protein [Halomonas sp. PBN3]|uniref:TolC family outer membrane protein n=1 Tax=Halomonas sp. PBN3 TaxID=1397528 RepID=UPI0003B8BDD2|nr:TolC family outer membrane protein [Halomonas sp. PBN3]ERS91175.1 hypothetical protein Q671_04730 [Halomonas sp. PBN3]